MSVQTALAAMPSHHNSFRLLQLTEGWLASANTAKAIESEHCSAATTATQTSFYAHYENFCQRTNELQTWLAGKETRRAQDILATSEVPATKSKAGSRGWAKRLEKEQKKQAERHAQLAARAQAVDRILVSWTGARQYNDLTAPSYLHMAPDPAPYGIVLPCPRDQLFLPGALTWDQMMASLVDPMDPAPAPAPAPATTPSMPPPQLPSQSYDMPARSIRVDSRAGKQGACSSEPAISIPAPLPTTVLIGNDIEMSTSLPAEPPINTLASSVVAEPVVNAGDETSDSSPAEPVDNTLARPSTAEEEVVVANNNESNDNDNDSNVIDNADANADAVDDEDEDDLFGEPSTPVSASFPASAPAPAPAPAPARAPPAGLCLPPLKKVKLCLPGQ